MMLRDRRMKVCGWMRQADAMKHINLKKQLKHGDTGNTEESKDFSINQVKPAW